MVQFSWPGKQLIKEKKALEESHFFLSLQVLIIGGRRSSD